MKKLCLAALMASVPLPALAQSTLLQSGTWAPGHAPMYSNPGSSQPIVQDSGPAGGGGKGLGLNEQLLVERSPTNTYPAVNAGTGPLGTNWCDYDAPLTNATGYHYLCLGPNAQGGGLLTYGAGGGAAALPLTFNINGTIYNPVPGTLTVPAYTVLGNNTGSTGPVTSSTAPWIGSLTIGQPGDGNPGTHLEAYATTGVVFGTPTFNFGEQSTSPGVSSLDTHFAMAIKASSAYSGPGSWNSLYAYQYCQQQDYDSYCTGSQQTAEIVSQSGIASGNNPVCILDSPVASETQCYGSEIDSVANNASSVQGIQTLRLVNQGSGAATTFSDYLYLVSSGTTLEYGVHFGNQNGTQTFPVGSTGTLIYADTGTVKSGIDFSNLSGGGGGYAWKSPSATIDWSGNAVFNNLTANGVVLDSTGIIQTNSPLTSLTIKQTGASNGTTSLMLENGSTGNNGALFTNEGLDFVNFGFQTSTSASDSLWFIHDSLFVYGAGNSAGEFGLSPSSSYVPFLIAGPGTVSVANGAKFGAGTFSPTGLVSVGSITASAWTTSGIGLTESGTFTDSSTAASGTVANSYINKLGVPTIAASNATVTYTNAYTLDIEPPIAGTNVTITKAYGLRVNGATVITANAAVSGALVAAGSAPTATGAGGTCTAGALAGGATAGTVALTGACASTNTLALTVMPTAPTGYACEAHDRTQPATLLQETATSSTSATFTVSGTTSGATDVIQFSCLAY